MTFKPEVSCGDLIAAASFMTAAIALIFTFCQLRTDSKRKRAEFIISVANQYMTDAETSKMFYLLEYDQFKYSDKFHGSEEERRLDRLLSYFEIIATLYDMKMLTDADLKLVKYQFIRVSRNVEIKKYFEFLDGLEALNGGFKKFRKVAALLDQSV